MVQWCVCILQLLTEPIHFLLLTLFGCPVYQGSVMSGSCTFISPVWCSTVFFCLFFNFSFVFCFFKLTPLHNLFNHYMDSLKTTCQFPKLCFWGICPSSTLVWAFLMRVCVCLRVRLHLDKLWFLQSPFSHCSEWVTVLWVHTVQFQWINWRLSLQADACFLL